MRSRRHRARRALKRSGSGYNGAPATLMFDDYSQSAYGRALASTSTGTVTPARNRPWSLNLQMELEVNPLQVDNLNVQLNMKDPDDGEFSTYDKIC